MVELLRPDVYTDEQATPPGVPVVPVSNGGLLGIADRGPVNVPTIVGSFSAYVRRFGGYRSDSYLTYAVRGFFDNGGARCYIVRVINADASSAVATKTLKDHGGAATPGAVTSANAATFDLEPDQTLDVKVDGNAADTATFAATRATKAGAGGTGWATITTEVFKVKIDDGEEQTITFSSPGSIAECAVQINAQLLGGFAAVNVDNIDLSSDKRGKASKVEVTEVDVLIDTEIGIEVGSALGTGTEDLADINAVTAAEVKAVLEAALLSGSGVVVTYDGAGKITITSGTTGALSSIQVTGGTANTAFGFDTSEHSGSTSGESDTLTVDVRDVGVWGNLLRVTTAKVSTTLSAQLTGASATSATFTSVKGFEVGDVLYIKEGTDTVVAVIKSIALSTKIVTFLTPIDASAVFDAVTTTVETSSMHRANTQLSEDIPATAVTTAKLVNASAVVKGQILNIGDGTTMITVIVTNVQGNTITFGSVTPGTIISAATSLVISQEFLLVVTDNGIVQPPHEYLSMEATNVADYVEIRLNGEGNESLIIEATDESSGATAYKLAPKPVTLEALSGGLDGTAPGNADYTGDEAADPPTGLHALDSVTDVNFIAIPGITTVAVQGGAADYCKDRGDCTFINDPPEIKDLPEEVRDWRLNDLNKDTSYSSLFYPWVQIPDPEVDGQLLYMPPSGWMMGIRAFVARTNGPHTPPGNIAIRGIVGLAYEVSDGQHDTLNPIGVNVIRAYAGEGIRVMGVRTLQSKQDGKHYINVRELTNFVKNSLKRGLRPYLMVPIDPRVWRNMTGTCTSFLLGIWRQGMLYPSDNKDEAFKVKCDKENNPADVVAQARINAAVGINPPYPAEFIVLQVYRHGGAISIEE